MRRGNILLCVTLITLLAPSSPVNKWFSSFGPLQVGATSCNGLSYAARLTSRGYRLCFQDTQNQPNLCKVAGKSAWGYVVPPPASTGQADLLLRPLDEKCNSTAKVVGTATFSCAADIYYKPTKVTLVIANNAPFSLSEQSFFIGCKDTAYAVNYLQDCPTLDAATTPDCTAGGTGNGLGYFYPPKATCGGSIFNKCSGAVSCSPDGTVKTITIKVKPNSAYFTGCDDCRSFWWAVRQVGTYNCA